MEEGDSTKLTFGEGKKGRTRLTWIRGKPTFIPKVKLARFKVALIRVPRFQVVK